VKICCEVVGASKGSILRKWECILDYLLFYSIYLIIIYLFFGSGKREEKKNISILFPILFYFFVAREEAVTRVFLYKFLK
jgi:hypothetical protein